MRSIFRASMLATALAALALAGCVDSDSDKTDDTARTEQKTSAVHSKAKFKKHHAHADPVAHAKKLAEVLNLSADQQGKVEAIFKADSSWHDKKKQINDLLTPEQRTKLAEVKKQHHAKWKGKHPGWKHGHGDIAAIAKHKATWMQEKLGLTDKQRSDIEAAIKNGKTWSERKAAIHKLLTADQAEELKRLMKDRKLHHHGKMHR